MCVVHACRAAEMSEVDGDHYTTLGLSPSATTLEIKRAYHELAKKWHPDKLNQVHTHAHALPSGPSSRGFWPVDSFAASLGLWALAAPPRVSGLLHEFRVRAGSRAALPEPRRHLWLALLGPTTPAAKLMGHSKGSRDDVRLRYSRALSLEARHGPHRATEFCVATWR